MWGNDTVHNYVAVVATAGCSTLTELQRSCVFVTFSVVIDFKYQY